MRRLSWKHKNLLLFGLGILVTYLVLQNQWFHHFLLNLGKFGYLGAFLAGMLFVSTFTMMTGVLILLSLAKVLPAFPLVVIAGLGAVTSDYLIFAFVRNDVGKEVSLLYEELEKMGKKNHLRKLVHTKYFGWMLQVVGAFIILSPLPDELGVSLLGISNIKSTRFLLISLCSHGLGMFLVVSAATLL